MPRVSVIIPTRNRASLVGVAVASALRQTFAEIEIVVVDDASDDETSSVVSSFRDSRLRYVRHEVRRGGSAARNTGIDRSSGEFVAFLDDDDEWLPEKLAVQMEQFGRCAPKVGVVYSSYLVVDRETGRVTGRKVATARGDLSRQILSRNVIGGTSSVLIRRSCLDVAGVFDELLPSFQDYDLWIRISREFDFEYTDRNLMKYYLHPRRIWSDLDALNRGIELMLGKYGQFREMRRNLALQSLGLGVQYCSRGDIAQGRRALRRSISLNPYAVRAYLNFALSLLGSDTFRASHDAKARMRIHTKPSNFTSPDPFRSTIPESEAIGCGASSLADESSEVGP